MAHWIKRGFWHKTTEIIGGWFNLEEIEYDVNALTDGATIDLNRAKHTLATNASARTFTISHRGDTTLIELTLSATDCTLTFPAGSLCVSEGAASGDNTLALSGVSGDKYLIAIEKVGNIYYVSSKNFGQ